MRRKVSEKPPWLLCVAAAVSCALLGCASDHHVTPWGGVDRVPVSMFIQPPNLGTQLAEVDRETKDLGLVRMTEIPGDFGHGGGPFRVLGYSGHDAIKRPIFAVRVVTSRAVALAVGPLDTNDVDRRRATELVVALQPGSDPTHPLEGSAFRSGTDLTGDGSPDVVLKSETGVIEIWHLDPFGAAAYEVVMEALPTKGEDVDRDGRVDLTGKVLHEPGDAILPELEDAATFEGGRFTNGSPGARTFHAAKLAAVEAAASKPAANEEERLRRALERAFHGILAGRASDVEMKRLDAEREPPARLSNEFERIKARIERLAGQHMPRPVEKKKPVAR